MGSIKVKICGLKSETDVGMCMKLGVDIIGFVVEYPLPVPWNLSHDQALPLLRLVQPPHRSCIVTGGAPQKVIELAASLRPDLVQLHYQETLADTIIISDALREMDIDVIKTVPPAMEDWSSQFGTVDIETIVGELCKTSIYGLLADSRVPANASENGTELDLRFCSQIIKLSSKPVIIAGGINADNVCDFVKQTGASFIDVMTGVESSPGEKDAALLSRLLAAVRNLG
ncbi:MAG: phosphoribosylanthranilate isomerase [Desulfotomaculaceae bacterium]|nr:phosphoribosylanthranilate isomerase [Desulfotomaculaceae bacterium]